MLKIAPVYGRRRAEWLRGGPAEYPCKILNFSVGFTSRSENKEVRWVNPHTHFLLDVDDLYTFTFVGYQARDGSKLAFVEFVTGPDGKTVKIWFGDPKAN